MLDLKRLSHIVALADERHFAHAAQRVHLSQPAFSRSIQSIERDVGMQLFDREAGDIKPTPAGAFLIERARRLLSEARNIDRDTALFRESQLGETAFGAGPFPAVTIVPAALARLRARHPNAGMRVELSNWQQLLERLRAEDIEFFVADIRALPADPQLDVVSLGRQAGHVYARSAHPLAGRRCTLAEVWRHGLASIKLPGEVRAQLAPLLGLAPGVEPALALECDDVTLLCTLALATDTLFLATDASVRGESASGRITQIEVDDLPALHAEMGMVQLVHRTPSPMARHAMACIRAVAQEINIPPDP